MALMRDQWTIGTRLAGLTNGFGGGTIWRDGPDATFSPRLTAAAAPLRRPQRGHLEVEARRR
jgi:hypothetical protein